MHFLIVFSFFFLASTIEIELHWDIRSRSFVVERLSCAPNFSVFTIFAACIDFTNFHDVRAVRFRTSESFILHLKNLNRNFFIDSIVGISSTAGIFEPNRRRLSLIRYWPDKIKDNWVCPRVRVLRVSKFIRLLAKSQSCYKIPKREWMRNLTFST